MKQRKWTADEKLAIVLEGIRGKKAVTEICREHHLSQTQYYKWRDKFLEGGRKALTVGTNGKESRLEAEIEKLQKIIGKQAIQIEILKKTEEWMNLK
jgi:transposase-like protein